jgi:hypothetical protein
MSATKEETLALERQPQQEVEIVPYSDAHVFDLQDVKQRVDAIHRIMAKQMKKDVHYGVIPGTKKPTLYKPGSEILLLTFRVAIDPEITDLSTPDEIRYRIRAIGRHVPTDSFMGAGVGECSSNEEKFLWRAALSKEEYNDTPEDQRRLKYKKEWDRGRPTIIKVEQIKVPTADAANAVLKRAKKRAQVDFCLTAMAASEIFTQDVEDLPDGYLNDDTAPVSTDPPVSEPQKKKLRYLFDQLSEAKRIEVLAFLTTAYKQEIKTIDDIPAHRYKHAETTLGRALNKEAAEKAEAEVSARIIDVQVTTLQEVIEGIGKNCKAEFLTAFKIKKIGELPTAKYPDALKWLEQQRRK